MRGARRRPPRSGPARRGPPRDLRPPPLPGATAAAGAAVAQRHVLHGRPPPVPTPLAERAAPLDDANRVDLYRWRRPRQPSLAPQPPPSPIFVSTSAPPNRSIQYTHPSTDPPPCPIGPPPHHPPPRCAPWCRHCRLRAHTVTRGRLPTGSGGGGGARRAPPQPRKALWLATAPGVVAGAVPAAASAAVDVPCRGAAPPSPDGRRGVPVYGPPPWDEYRT